ncbi:linear amide C-N hydrolase [Tissierella creatinophila]|uniref:Choloylglycine hydrolase n=1 Tax=Tissierella creatinophila DSM 6911 TaxID=1123403 RepID=A0A1U7M7K9_TISCR|nr:linear amide C-N hydrolase [Tissierella creatinophila]OLS03240.1 choloylglycine hydrolase [Tissierella creatinophila DSM 6911]
MCTTIGFKYKEGFVFGRTLEIGIKMDNKILYVPAGKEDFIEAKGLKFPSKYATIGTSFFDITSFGDGINEMGLMGSNNFLPGYASFSKHPVIGRISMTISNAFDYLLTRCKDVDEVRERAEKIVILNHGEDEEDKSTSSHFFFMDANGKGIVLEPQEGTLIAHDNPYGVLTNSPEFPWHVTNLKNYINLRPQNTEKGNFNGETLSKLGEGTGMIGLPGDFTPPSRFVRAAYFVSNTPKALDRTSAILQGFRILSQFDIPTGSVIDPIENHADETLYTSIMDTKKCAYFIKCHDNISIQPFYLDDYKDAKDIKTIKLRKVMDL